MGREIIDQSLKKTVREYKTHIKRLRVEFRKLIDLVTFVNDVTQSRMEGQGFCDVSTYTSFVEAPKCCFTFLCAFFARVLLSYKQQMPNKMQIIVIDLPSEYLILGTFTDHNRISNVTSLMR